MSVIVGPTSWWLKSKEANDYYARICPLGTILPDGSAIWCKAGGRAWLVTPSCTQVSQQWAGGCYNSTLVGNKCCICDWPGAGGIWCTLINCGFNPCDWFIPNQDTLYNSYICRARWDTSSLTIYWSSSECVASFACNVNFCNGNQGSNDKSFTLCVRAFRCVCL